MTQKAIAAIVLAIFFLSGAPARGQQKLQSTFLTATIRNADFDNHLGAIYHQRNNQSASHQINVHIPAVYLYDPSGTLIYAGFDPNRNAALLQHLPQSAKGLQKVDGLLERNEIFNAVPEFVGARQKIEQAHHYLVLALTNFPHIAYEAKQDSAVRQVGEKSASSGVADIDVLQLAVDMRPAPGSGSR